MDQLLKLGTRLIFDKPLTNNFFIPPPPPLHNLRANWAGAIHDSDVPADPMVVGSSPGGKLFLKILYPKGADVQPNRRGFATYCGIHDYYISNILFQDD